MSLEMQKRWTQALKQPCKAMLFDIDKNLADEDGSVNSAVISALSDLVSKKKIILGFVSGRPEKTLYGNTRIGKEIMIVVEEILKCIPSEFSNYIVIFPEHAGYGKNIGSGEVYEFGFQKLMEEFPIENLIEYLSKLNWYDHIEIKKTGISIWSKEIFRNKNDIENGVLDVKRWSVEKMNQQVKILNGANRTVDILFNEVNKVRSVLAVSQIFGIPPDQIATSDDQADIGQTGFDLTNKPLGFATNEFYSKYEHTNQIVTQFAFGKTQVEANLHIIQNLKFLPSF